jgi:hypothetical protein
VIIAAISTAEGAEPGMPSASAGMIPPGIEALSPVSAAMRPSMEPLPNNSFSLLARRAAAYEDQAAMSSPTPGRMPMYTPMTPERRMVRQYLTTSRRRGSTESTLLTMAFWTGCDSTVRISDRPNAPISAGISDSPPDRSLEPKVKRSCAWMPSWPTRVRNRPANPISQPLMGSLPAMVPDIITPNSASQKNSKAPNESAASPSEGVSRARQTMPNSEPATEPQVAMPIARPACPLRASW